MTSTPSQMLAGMLARISLEGKLITSQYYHTLEELMSRSQCGATTTSGEVIHTL